MLFKFIADQLHPRGPLHPTHALVLRAKDYIKAYIYEYRSDEVATEGELELTGVLAQTTETSLRNITRYIAIMEFLHTTYVQCVY